MDRKQLLEVLDPQFQEFITKILNEFKDESTKKDGNVGNPYDAYKIQAKEFKALKGIQDEDKKEEENKMEVHNEKKLSPTEKIELRIRSKAYLDALC